uniref:Uncharacterized protein n=1 Tax=Setaria italica TaxID=4555 RepID=K3Y0N8_SETIT
MDRNTSTQTGIKWQYIIAKTEYQSTQWLLTMARRICLLNSFTNLKHNIDNISNTGASSPAEAQICKV